jgi:hypothetical protein
VPKNLTPELVHSFYAEACAHYGAEVKNKADSQFMTLVGSLLDAIGVVDKEVFLQNFTTTVGTVIYAPFTVGVGDSAALWGQVTTLVHELVHVTQFKHAPAEFMLKYLCDKSARATYEAEAYSAGLELYIWNGEPVDVAALSQSLLSYGLGQNYAEFMAKYLEIRVDVYQQGGEINETSIWAKQWLLAHGVTPDSNAP